MRPGAAAVGLAAALAALAPPASADDPLRVSVAASLAPALAEAAQAWGEAEVELNAAASAVLVQQARRGAPVDLLLAASVEEVDALAAAGLLHEGARRQVATNRLVVIVPEGTPSAGLPAALDEPRFDRIAIGNPRTAPVGRYARQALDALGLGPPLEPRLVFGESARQVLEYVARGEAAAGIVYRTDVALARGRVQPAAELAPELHAPIVYEGAVLAGAASAEQARRLLDWLVSGEGRAVLARHGFGPPPG